MSDTHWADIIVESFFPATMARWGLSYQELTKILGISDELFVELLSQGVSE